MKLKLVLLLLALFCCRLLHTNALAQVTPQWQWVKSGGGNGTGPHHYFPPGDVGHSIATDDFGIAYVAGSFYDTAYFGSYKLNGQPHDNYFLAKYDQQGNVVWAQEFKSADIGYLFTKASVGTDAAGNVYVGCVFPRSLTVGSTVINGQQGYNYSVMKFLPNGTLVWHKAIPASVAAFFSYTTSAEFSVTKSGTVHVLFNLQTITVDSVTAVSPPHQQSVHVVQLSPQGKVNWIQNLSARGLVHGTALTTDVQENVYVSLNVGSNKMQVGSKKFKVTNDSSMLVLCKLNSQGEGQWVGQVPGTRIFITALAADPAGNCFGTGYFSDTVHIGGQTYVSRGMYDLITFKHNSAGVFQWAATAGGDDPSFDNSSFPLGMGDEAWGITTDRNGNCYITGACLTAARFDTVTLSSSSRGAFVASYNAHGRLNFVKKTAGGVAKGLSLTAAGDVYITGAFRGGMHFGTDSLSGDHEDVFIAKLNVGIIAGTKAERQQPELCLYPNPVQHTLQIRFPEQHNVTHLRLLNLNGQLVREVPVQQEVVLQLPVQGLAKGLYLLQVHGNGEVWHRKVVVE